ncbi:type II toxin-antitoxin system HicA family toxin [Cupriavidus sp. DL-D2]|uniref:type II toxin-antitoxin system HicA family toxin n=1 Tax=Cupriavidus sp. DL-D2 TaxID=3144974 RepID=UPI003212E5E0
MPQKWYTKKITKILALVIVFDYHTYIATNNGGAVKQSEFVRELAAKGATFKQGKKHLKVTLNGQQTVVPRHAKELKTGTVEAIRKQLGLK